MKKRHKDPAKLEIKERVGKYMEENQRLLQKYGLSYDVVINFPRYRRLPIRCRIAMGILAKSGASPDLRIKPLK
jgi:hypothetical protein